MKKRDAIFMHVASGIVIGTFAALTLNQCTSCQNQDAQNVNDDASGNKTEVVVPAVTQIVVINPTPVKPAPVKPVPVKPVPVKPVPVKPQPAKPVPAKPVYDNGAKVVVKGGDNVIVAGDNNNVTVNNVIAPDTVKKSAAACAYCKVTRVYRRSR